MWNMIEGRGGDRAERLEQETQRVGILGGKDKAVGRIGAIAQCALSRTRNPWLTPTALILACPEQGARIPSLRSRC